MIDSHKKKGSRRALYLKIQKLWILMHRPTLLIFKNIPSYHLKLQCFMIVKEMFHLMVHITHLCWVKEKSLPSMLQSRPKKILLTFLIHREEIKWFFLEIYTCSWYIRYEYKYITFSINLANDKFTHILFVGDVESWHDLVGDQCCSDIQFGCERQRPSSISIQFHNWYLPSSWRYASGCVPRSIRIRIGDHKPELFRTMHVVRKHGSIQLLIRFG